MLPGERITDRNARLLGNEANYGRLWGQFISPEQRRAASLQTMGSAPIMELPTGEWVTRPDAMAALTSPEVTNPYANAGYQTNPMWAQLMNPQAATAPAPDPLAAALLAKAPAAARPNTDPTLAMSLDEQLRRALAAA